MASNSIGHFGANFLQAFQAARQGKEDREDRKKERDAKMKLFELQMKREQAAAAQAEEQMRAREQVYAQLGGFRGPTPYGGIDESGAMGGANAPHGGVGPVRAPFMPQPTSLTELLADPNGALLLLQAGMLKPDDIMAQEGARANRAMVERLMGGGGAAGGMELTGVKIGPNGQLMPDFGLPQITSPQAVDTPEGPRLRTFNPRTGATVADLGAPKEEKRTPEEAGRISGLLQAQEIGAGVREKIIKPDGSVNRALVMTAFGKVPGSQGRTLRNDMGIAVDAVLRARTGAGVNNEELRQVVDQFMPSPLDGDAGIVSKMDRFDQFVNGALDVATLPPRVRKALEGQQRQPQGGGKVIDFSELPD
jgi:hypothetical protein